MNSYLTQWSLRDPRQMADTRASTVYKVLRQDGSPAVLKILKEIDVQDEKNGAALLQWYDAKGAIIVYDYDERAHLLEFADGMTLQDYIAQGHDHEAMTIVADIARNLQKPRALPPPSGLISLEDRFEELFIKARKDQAQSSDSIFVTAAALAQHLLDTQTLAIALHGDLHHENILQSARGWLAIDAKGIWGDPAYEVGNIFCNPYQMEDLVQNETRIDKMADIFAETLNLSKRRILQFAAVHAALSACWTILEGGNPAHRMKMAQLTLSHAKKS